MDADVERIELDRIALEIAELLPEVAATLRVAALFDATASDLTANQLVALLLVGQADGGQMRAGDIARRMSISAASATTLVDRLVDSGKLVRTRGDDRRIVWVSVTEAGNELIRQLKAGTVSRIASALATADVESRRQLVHSLRQVVTFASTFSDTTGP